MAVAGVVMLEATDVGGRKAECDWAININSRLLRVHMRDDATVVWRSVQWQSLAILALLEVRRDFRL